MGALKIILNFQDLKKNVHAKLCWKSMAILTEVSLAEEKRTSVVQYPWKTWNKVLWLFIRNIKNVFLIWNEEYFSVTFLVFIKTSYVSWFQWCGFLLIFLTRNYYIFLHDYNILCYVHGVFSSGRKFLWNGNRN